MLASSSEYSDNKIVVMNGRSFLNNFELDNQNYILSGSGAHLAMIAAFEVTFTNALKDTTILVNRYRKLTYLPTPPKKEGYIFEGWYTAETGGTEVTTNTVFNANTTVYAQWAEGAQTPYVVTFDANGGSVTTESAEAGEDGKLTFLPTPTREGHIFEGWFTAATGGTEVTTNTVFTENITVYARWTGTTPIFSNKENPIIQRIEVYAIDNTIMLKNLPLNAKIEIYNLRGEHIYSTTSHFPLATSLTIPVLTKGMYVVKVANQMMRTVVR